MFDIGLLRNHVFKMSAGSWLTILGFIALLALAQCGPTAPTPVITLSPSSASSCPNVVTLTDVSTDPTLAIYYTTDGSQPNTTVGGATKRYSGQIQINAPIGNAPNAIVSAVAITQSLPVSPTVTQAFTCGSGQVPSAPVFSPAAGTVTCPLNVTVSDATAGAEMLLNQNATVPNWNSHGFLGPFGSVPISATTTLTAVALIPGSNPPATNLLSSASTATYTCQTSPYSSLVVMLTTGNDGINGDSSVNMTVTGLGLSGPEIFCLKGKNGAACPAPVSNTANVDQSPVLTGSGWPNSLFTLVTVPVPPMTQAAAQSATGTLQIQLINGDSSCGNFGHEGCDNWRIQNISAELDADHTHFQPVQLLNVAGPSNADDDNCVVFLKAPPNATTVQFSLGGSANSHTYLNGTAAENGIVTTCKDNGDGGPVP